MVVPPRERGNVGGITGVEPATGSLAINEPVDLFGDNENQQRLAWEADVEREADRRAGSNVVDDGEPSVSEIREFIAQAEEMYHDGTKDSNERVRLAEGVINAQFEAGGISNAELYAAFRQLFRLANPATNEEHLWGSDASYKALELLNKYKNSTDQHLVDVRNHVLDEALEGVAGLQISADARGGHDRLRGNNPAKEPEITKLDITPTPYDSMLKLREKQGVKGNDEPPLPTQNSGAPTAPRIKAVPDAEPPVPSQFQPIEDKIAEIRADQTAKQKKTKARIDKILADDLADDAQTQGEQDAVSIESTEGVVDGQQTGNLRPDNVGGEVRDGGLAGQSPAPQTQTTPKATSRQAGAKEVSQAKAGKALVVQGQAELPVLGSGVVVTDPDYLWGLVLDKIPGVRTIIKDGLPQGNTITNRFQQSPVWRKKIMTELERIGSNSQDNGVFNTNEFLDFYYDEYMESLLEEGDSPPLSFPDQYATTTDMLDDYDSVLLHEERNGEGLSNVLIANIKSLRDGTEQVHTKPRNGIQGYEGQSKSIKEAATEYIAGITDPRVAELLNTQGSSQPESKNVAFIDALLDLIESPPESNGERFVRDVMADVMVKGVPDGDFTVKLGDNTFRIRDFFKDGYVDKTANGLLIKELGNGFAPYAQQPAIDKNATTSKKEIVEQEGEKRTQVDQTNPDTYSVDADFDNINDGNYRRASNDTDVEASLPVGQIRAFVSMKLARYRVKPSVVVTANQATLKQEYPDLHKQGVASRIQKDFDKIKATGFSVGDKVVIFSDNIFTREQVEATLAHEAIGHFGLRVAVPESRLRQMLDKVYLKDGYIRIMADRQMAAGVPRLEAIEEALADNAEVLDASVVSRAWVSIKNFLNKIGIGFDDDMSRYIFTQSRANLRRGGSGLVSPQQLLKNINDLKRRAGDGRFNKVRTEDETKSFMGNMAFQMHIRNNSIKDVNTLERMKAHLDKKPKDIHRLFRNFKHVFSTLNRDANESYGQEVLFQKLAQQGGFTNVIQHMQGDLVDGVGITKANAKDMKVVNNMLSILTVHKFQSLPEIDKLPALTQVQNLGTSRVAVLNQAGIDAVKKMGFASIEQMRSGLNVTIGGVEETIKFPNITDKTYKMLQGMREAIDTTIILELETALDVRSQRSADLVDMVGRDYGDPTGRRGRSIELVRDTYINTYNEGGYVDTDGRWKQLPESVDKARLFIRNFQRALHVQDKAGQWGAIARGETFDTTHEDDAAMADAFDNDEYRAVAKAIAEFGLVDSADDAYKIANAMENLLDADVNVDTIERNAKRTIAGAYIPLPREGLFETYIVMQDVETGKFIRPVDDMKSLFSYTQHPSEKDADVERARLDTAFEGQVFEVQASEDTQEVRRVKFVAQTGRSVQVSGLSNSVSISEFKRTLDHLGIGLTPAEQTRVITALSSLDSSLRNAIKREHVPGWDENVIQKGGAPWLEMKSHTIAKMKFGGDFDGVLGDNKLWHGDRAKLKALHDTMKEAEKGDDIDTINITQREYDRYAHQYNVSAPKGANDTTTIYAGYGRNRKPKEVANQGRGNEFRDKGVERIQWYSETADIVDGTDSIFGEGTLAKFKALSVVMQLGMNVALAVHNATVPYFSTVPHLATYNSKRGYGGGFGFGKSISAILLASLDSVNPKLAHGKYIDDAIVSGSSKLDPWLLKGLKHATDRGTLQSQQFKSILGLSRTGFSSNQSRAFINGWMTPFTYSEQFGRRTAFIAAYRLEAQKRASFTKDENLIHEAALDFATKAVNNSQGEYSMYNRPAISRGSITQHIMVYKQYPISMIENLSRMPWKGKLAMLAAFFVASGIKGLPGAEDFADLVDTLAQKFGIRMGSIEKAAAEMFDSILPGSAPYMLRGFIDPITGGTHSSGLGLGNLFPLTRVLTADDRPYEELKDFLGPVYHGTTGIIGTAGQVARYAGEKAGLFDDNTTLTSIARGSPVAALKALGDGFSYMDNGAITNKKGQVVAPDVTTKEVVLRMFGLYPRRATLAYDVVRLGKQSQAYRRQIKASYVSSWVKARLTGDNKKRREVEENVRRINRAARGTDFEIRNFYKSATRSYKAAKDTQYERFLKSDSIQDKPFTKHTAQVFGIID